MLLLTELNQSNRSSQTTKYIQAYKLFFQGKTSYEVALELQIREKETREYYVEYLKLDRADTLSRLYRIHGPGFITQVE